MKRMRKVSPGLVCIVLGVVLLLAAGGLYAYNRYEDAHAGAEAQTVVADLQQKVETPEPEAESGPLDPELPVVEIDGNEYVGEISIPAIGVKNYYLWEGETTASMKKGLGHFTSTSVWNGNVAVCGHNRGAKYVIGSIKDLDVGDKITYTTSMGTRTYLVETVTKISSSDWSYLSSTTDNRMTLLTCVAGDSSQRWCVQAVQAS